MKILTSTALAGVVFFCGCLKNSPEVEQENAEWLSVGDPVPAPYYVNPVFPGGSSILRAAQKAFPGSDSITLYSYWLGSDGSYEFALFYVGREVKTGWESFYFRDIVFVKSAEDPDWSNARVFDCPEVPRAPFNGPIEFLEEHGEEFGKEPIPVSADNLGQSHVSTI